MKEIILPNTNNDPFEQLKFLSDVYRGTKRKTLKAKYTTNFRKFLSFLEENGAEVQYSFPDKFYPERYLGQYVSIAFKDFLMKQSLSLETKSSTLSSINKFLAFIESNGLTKERPLIYDSIQYQSIGSDGVHDSFSDSEVMQIKKALESKMVLINQLIHFPAYKKTGRGISPYEKTYDDGSKSRGFNDLDNCIHYFENQLMHDPVSKVRYFGKISKRIRLKNK